VVVIPAVGLSLLASVALVAGSDSVTLLFVGRLLAGISSGAVFGAGKSRGCSPSGARRREWLLISRTSC
jgi:hypothetical protein